MKVGRVEMHEGEIRVRDMKNGGSSEMESGESRFGSLEERIRGLAERIE